MTSHKYMLVFLCAVLALRMLTHVVLIDGSSNSTARFELDKGNGDWIVYYFWIYGDYQIAILLFDLYALISKCEKRILECIGIHTLLSMSHLMMIHYFWQFIKSYPFPFDESHKRPGSKLFYIECPISTVYMIYVLLRYFYNKQKSN